MKILRNNSDKKIVLNTETDFRTDLGWEESFQEFEHETLKSIINPAENFETVRYIHQPYVGLCGMTQTDIWYEFYFRNSSGGTTGGLDYELIGLSAEDNSKILKSENASFFRLEFYKVPTDETPNSNNRKLVFTKNLTIPLSESLNYTPINKQIHVPVFVGSNFRNKENMFLYWFQDDSVFEGTLLSGNTASDGVTITGNTFYMTAKFYNTIDGTSLGFTNKPLALTDPIDESEDIYHKVVTDISDYSYVVYTGITEDHRAGESNISTPLRFYAVGASSSSLDPYIDPSPTPTISTTPSITPSSSLTPTPSPSEGAPESPTPTPTPTPDVTPSISPSATLPVQVSAARTYLSFDEDGGPYDGNTIQITSVENWSANEADPENIILGFTHSGTSEGYLGVDIKPHTGTGVRMATITVSAGVGSVDITICQDGTSETCF